MPVVAITALLDAVDTLRQLNRDSARMFPGPVSGPPATRQYSPRPPRTALRFSAAGFSPGADNHFLIGTSTFDISAEQSQSGDMHIDERLAALVETVELLVEHQAAGEERHDREMADIRRDLRRAFALGVQEARNQRRRGAALDEKITARRGATGHRGETARAGRSDTPRRERELVNAQRLFAPFKRAGTQKLRERKDVGGVSDLPAVVFRSFTQPNLTKRLAGKGGTRLIGLSGIADHPQLLHTFLRLAHNVGRGNLRQQPFPVLAHGFRRGNLRLPAQCAKAGYVRDGMPRISKPEAAIQHRRKLHPVSVRYDARELQHCIVGPAAYMEDLIIGLRTIQDQQVGRDHILNVNEIPELPPNLLV